MLGKIQSFILECVAEIRHKVSWPSYSSLQSFSLLVLIALIAFSFIIGAIDLSFRKIFGFVYGLF